MRVGLILSVLVFWSYITFIVYKFGVQPSISASYYVLPVNRQFLFSSFCILYSIPIAYPSNSEWFWLATLFVMLVGAASAYRGDKLINLVHTFSAFMCVIFSHVAMCVDNQTYYVSYVSIAITLGLMLSKNKIPNSTWWAEIVTYLAIVVSIITK